MKFEKLFAIGILIPSLSFANNLCLDLFNVRSAFEAPQAATLAEYGPRSMEPFAPVKDLIQKILSKTPDFQSYGENFIIFRAVHDSMTFIESKSSDRRFADIRKILAEMNAEDFHERSIESGNQFVQRFVEKKGSLRALSEILEYYHNLRDEMRNPLPSLSDLAIIREQGFQNFDRLLKTAVQLKLIDEAKRAEIVRGYHKQPKAIERANGLLLLRTTFLEFVRDRHYGSYKSEVEDAFAAVIAETRKNNEIPARVFEQVVANQSRPGESLYGTMPKEVLFLPEFQKYIAGKKSLTRDEASHLMVSMSSKFRSDSVVSMMGKYPKEGRSPDMGFVRTLILITNMIFANPEARNEMPFLKVIQEIGGQPQNIHTNVYRMFYANFVYLNPKIAENIPLIENIYRFASGTVLPETLRLIIHVLNSDPVESRGYSSGPTHFQGQSYSGIDWFYIASKYNTILLRLSNSTGVSASTIGKMFDRHAMTTRSYDEAVKLTIDEVTRMRRSQ